MAQLHENLTLAHAGGCGTQCFAGVQCTSIFDLFKYLCPIAVLLKPMSYFSLLCVHCGKCLWVCPMDVGVNREARKRKNGTSATSARKCAPQRRRIEMRDIFGPIEWKSIEMFFGYLL